MRAARPLVASLAVVAAALTAFGCSSKSNPVASGGAIWQMQGASCQDRTTHTLAVVDPNGGAPSLLTDGADGARVRCQLSSSSFSVLVANGNGTLIASGSLSGANGTNVAMTISLPGGTYQTTTQKCLLAVTANDGSNFKADINCPELDNTSLPGDECSISNTGTSVHSFFSFQNCSGF